MNRNSNREVRVTTADGRTWVESYRNSAGGYVNMLDRVATAIDGTVRPRIDVDSVTDEGASYTTRDGVEFSTGPVVTEADRI